MRTPVAWLTVATLACAAIAVLILGWYLLRRPPLIRGTKIWLLFGLGIFPGGAALLGNIAGFENSKERRFCASCHVMDAQVRDAVRPESASLASFHSRNARFGTQSCYICHADYGMFGAVSTKLNGMRHMAAYYLKDWSGDAATGIALYEPYRSANCTQCHSTLLPGFGDEPEHAAVMDDIRKGAIGCAAAGCHGPAHPRRTAAVAGGAR